MSEEWERTKQLHHLIEEGSDLPTALTARPDASGMPPGPHGDVTSVSSEQQQVVLGRGAGCDVVLDDDRVSRRHAIVYIDGSNAWIEDLGSTNGTYVDGRLVEGAVPLHEGAAIRFGRRGPVFRYGRQLPGVRTSGQGVPPPPSGPAARPTVTYYGDDSAPKAPPPFGR